MKLFESIKIGDMELKNRFVMAPMVTGFAEKDGFVTQQLIDYYVRRAQGGCGLITIEGTCVEPIFCPDHGLRMDDDKFIEGMSSLAEAIKSAGAKVMLQLAHIGKQMLSKGLDREPVAPSAVPDPFFREIPHALTLEEIQELIDRFVQAAIRAKKAGFDGVNIHGAHGYLINQFLSPFDNIRDDRYGGDTRGRSLFAIEIIKGIREALGTFPISFRISVEHYVDGLHLNEAKSIVRLLEEAGADAIDVSAGRYASIGWMIQPMSQPPGCLVPLAAEIRRITRKPVIVAGRIRTPELAEQILTQESADLIALGRPLFADPDFPKKVEEGRFEEIHPCISCNTCFDTRARGQDLKCAANPDLKHGHSVKLSSVQRPKRVLVVGGGPGGMEAARSLAIRGHQVSLWERTDHLGGQLFLATVPPGRKEFFCLFDFYKNEMQRLGVDLRFGKEASVESIQQVAPHAVIIATGATPAYPQIPGTDSPHVVTAHDILAGLAEAGERVVIIGGAITGCETALYLASKGHQVTVLRRGKRMAVEAGWTARTHLLEELMCLGVTLLTNIEYKSMDAVGLRIIDKGEEKLLPADTVVLAAGVEPNRDLFEKLRGKIPELFAIGDCKEPRDMADAIEEGRMAALQI